MMALKMASAWGTRGGSLRWAQGGILSTQGGSLDAQVGTGLQPVCTGLAELQAASASLPPAARVIATHMFTVVGSADMASKPARSLGRGTPQSQRREPGLAAAPQPPH